MQLQAWNPHVNMSSFSNLSERAPNAPTAAELLCAIDPRALGLFRILLGLLLMHDWWEHWSVYTIFYSDHGAVPASTLAWDASHPFRLSLFQLSSSEWAVRAIFSCGFASLLLFTAGVCTGGFQVLSLIFFVSLLNQGRGLSYGGDHLLSLLLLWGLFLPLGAAFSMDAWWRQKTSKTALPAYTRSIAGFLLIFQFASVYLIAAANKSCNAEWISGDALGLVLIGGQATPAGWWLGTHLSAWMLQWMTWGAMAVEFAVFAAIFSPLAQPFLRRTIIAILLFFNCFIAFSLDVFDFPYIMIACLILLVRFGDRDNELAANAATTEARRWHGRTIVATSIIVFLFVTMLSVMLRSNRGVQVCGEFPGCGVFDATADLLAMKPQWNLFSGERFTHWWAVKATLTDGAVVDPIADRPFTWQRPSRTWGLRYKYLTSLIQNDDRTGIAHYISHLHANDRQGECAVRGFRLYRVSESNGGAHLKRRLFLSVRIQPSTNWRESSSCAMGIP